ncbi:MAG TPA: alanine racemase [Paucimonas sp.]|nr:alanine racemase [Paucimonas sp.]
MIQSPSHAGAVLTIDLDAIVGNYCLLRERAGRASCAAVVKADAYGLGAVHVAPTLAAAGCRQFFVAHLDEAITLRPHLPAHTEVFVLHGPPPGSDAEFLQHRLIPVLNGSTQLAAWRRLAQRENRRLPAIVQVDTGMARLGLSPDEVDAWLAMPDCLEGIELRYLMSHLACAEQQEHPMNRIQLDRFNAFRARLPACAASFANSSGIFLGPDFHFDLVRPGAALYGVAPIDGAANPMQSVVRLQGRIIQTRTIAAGDCVGYGARYRSAGAARIATVAVGYADGWLRNASNRGVAFIDGIEVPQVGTISMDTITLDVSAIDPARALPGMAVDLISPENPIDAVAARAGTIGYEILTSLGVRYQREYIGGSGGQAARCA